MAMNKVISTSLAPAPIGPYEQAILAGNTLYVSGQIPINPTDGMLVSDTYANATKQVMNNINAVDFKNKVSYKSCNHLCLLPSLHF